MYAYQRGLKFTKMTRVAPHQLPGSKDHLYLGEGFAWTQLHTQRKLDTQAVKVREYVKPSPAEMRLAHAGEQVRKWAENKTDSLLRQLVRRAVDIGGPANPFASGVDLGGSPILHGVGVQDEKPVLLRQGSRNGHMLVMGTTRVGKTRLLELLCTQDIHAGHVTIVIDPKGDAELMLRMHAEARRAGREKSFYLFHLGYPRSVPATTASGILRVSPKSPGVPPTLCPRLETAQRSRSSPGASPTSWRRRRWHWGGFQHTSPCSRT